MAEDMHVTFGQARDAGNLGELVDKQWVEIQGLVSEHRYTTDALNKALKEERKLRAILEGVQANPNKPFGIPARSKEFEHVLKASHEGHFKSWLEGAVIDVAPGSLGPCTAFGVGRHQVNRVGHQINPVVIFLPPVDIFAAADPHIGG